MSRVVSMAPEQSGIKSSLHPRQRPNSRSQHLPALHTLPLLCRIGSSLQYVSSQSTPSLWVPQTESMTNFSGYSLLQLTVGSHSPGTNENDYRGSSVPLVSMYFRWVTRERHSKGPYCAKSSVEH